MIREVLGILINGIIGLEGGLEWGGEKGLEGGAG